MFVFMLARSNISHYGTALFFIGPCWAFQNANAINLEKTAKDQPSYSFAFCWFIRWKYSWCFSCIIIIIISFCLVSLQTLASPLQFEIKLCGFKQSVAAQHQLVFDSVQNWLTKGSWMQPVLKWPEQRWIVRKSKKKRVFQMEVRGVRDVMSKYLDKTKTKESHK